MSVFTDHQNTTKGDLSFKKDKAARSALSNINFTHETKYSATPITMDEIDPDGHQSAKGPSPTARNTGNIDDERRAPVSLVRTTTNQPILTGQIEAKGTNRTASGAETTTKNNQNTCSLKTLRLASEAFGALQGNGTEAVQRTILDTPSPSSSRAYERGGGSLGSPMANTRPTTIGRKPVSASEQAPAPRAIPTYVHPPEPLTCSGITEEDTETQGKIDGENYPHGDAWNLFPGKTFPRGGARPRLRSHFILWGTHGAPSSLSPDHLDLGIFEEPRDGSGEIIPGKDFPAGGGSTPPQVEFNSLGDARAPRELRHTISSLKPTAFNFSRGLVSTRSRSGTASTWESPQRRCGTATRIRNVTFAGNLPATGTTASCTTSGTAPIG